MVLVYILFFALATNWQEIENSETVLWSPKQNSPSPQSAKSFIPTLLSTPCSFYCQHPIHHSHRCASLPRCLSGHLSPARFLDSSDPCLHHNFYLDYCISVLNSLSPAISHSALGRQKDCDFHKHDSGHVFRWHRTFQRLETILGRHLFSWFSRLCTICLPGKFTLLVLSVTVLGHTGSLQIPESALLLPGALPMSVISCEPCPSSRSTPKGPIL